MTPTTKHVLVGAGLLAGTGLLVTGIVMLTSFGKQATSGGPASSGGGGSPPPGGGGGSGPPQGPPAQGGGSGPPSQGGGGGSGGGSPPPTDPWANLRTRTDLFALSISNLQAIQDASVIPSIFLSQVLSHARAGLDFANQILRDDPQPPADMNNILGLTQSVAQLKADQGAEASVSFDTNAQASVDAVVGAAQDTLTAAVSALPVPQGGGATS